MGPRRPWQDTVVDVVDGWLFGSTDPLPEVLVVPLENPHLHDDRVWRDVFGEAVRTNGVVGLHPSGQEGHVGLARPVLGPAAVAMLVDAASRRGVRAVLGLGFCGGVADRLRCGDLLVVDRAEGDDAARAGYPAPADPVPGRRARALLTDGGLPGGPVRSVAAVHQETQSDVDRAAQDGVLGIDMETAALYAVAAERGLEAAAVLVVSDHPGRGLRAEPELLSQGLRDAVRLVHDVADAW